MALIGSPAGGLATPPPEPMVETIARDPDFSTATASTEPGSTVPPALLAAYAKIGSREANTSSRSSSSNNNENDNNPRNRHRPRRGPPTTTTVLTIRHRIRPPYFTIAITDTWEQARIRQKECSQCQKPTPGLPIPKHCKHPTSQEIRCWNIRCELVFYNKLIADGAQPFYNRRLIRAITHHPDKFVAVIGYWQDEDSAFFCVFRKQWLRWSSFRIWQEQMRTGYHFAWHLYIARTCSRLQSFNYCGPRVTLHRDPRRQDMLATWIEYLCFEITRYQEVSWYRTPRIQWDMYDRYWQRLVNTDVLGPHDARHRLETAQGKRERDLRKKQALEKIQLASSALLISQRDELDPKLDDEGRKRATEVREKMENKMQEACDRQRETTRWDRAIEEYCIQTTEYRMTRREGLKQEDYLCWVQFQIPHIRTRLRRSQGLTMKTKSVLGQGKRARVEEFETHQVEPEPSINFRSPQHPAKKQCIRHVATLTALAP